MSVRFRGSVDSLLRATAAAAFTAGVVCVAVGAWIPLKAWAAQLLIDAAWRRERTDSRAVAPWPWADTRPVGQVDLGGWKIGSHTLRAGGIERAQSRVRSGA